jgi:hypothetical protein
MTHQFEIPERMRHLPLDDRGYPIPYFVPIVNGVPDFRFQDIKKKEACRKYMKCSVCGGRLLTKSFWFIQGPLGLQNSIGSDEAMHEECARFSIQNCPHLLYQKSERRSSEVPGLPTMIRKKPPEMYLIHADKVYFIDAIHTRFRGVEVYPYRYEANKLIPA